MKILFLGESYRADAQTWIRAVEEASGMSLETKEIKTIRNRFIRVFQSFLFIVELLVDRWVKGNQYDIVLAERSTSYGFFSLLVNAKVHAIAQQGISDIFPNTFLSRLIKKPLQRLSYKHADIIHAWGNAMVPAMLKSGANPEKIMVMPKGIDLEKFSYTEHNRELDVTSTIIVTRSLEKDYQHWNILKAIHLLKNDGYRIKAVIVGSGSLLEELQLLTKQLQIDDQVEFTGRINNLLLPQYLNKCDLYISTPVTEGVSASLFEAMAAGCYPIVTDLPGNQAFIRPGINGDLVPIGDSISLAQAIKTYLLSKNKKQQVVRKNREFVELTADFNQNKIKLWERYLRTWNSKNA
jgi:glycosyltransferase involved in cell wall biosynthesis